jgi:protoheme IX farnesyltransferase
MLPVVRTSAQVARSIIIYSWVMVATSLVLIPVAPMGWLYAVGSVLLGAAFLYMAYQLRGAARRDVNVQRVAMRVFHGSITYLALLFLLIAVDPFFTR